MNRFNVDHNFLVIYTHNDRVNLSYLRVAQMFQFRTRGNAREYT